MKHTVKSDAVRRYDLINNKEHTENGAYKFPKHKMRRSNSPNKAAIGHSVKSPPIEHLKNSHLDKPRNLSPSSDTRSVGRPDTVASPNYPKFYGALGLAENGMNAQLQAALQFQAQQALLAQQLSLGQLNAVGIPSEFLSSFNSKLVPTSNHSPPILSSKTVTVPLQVSLLIASNRSVNSMEVF